MRGRRRGWPSGRRSVSRTRGAKDGPVAKRWMVWAMALAFELTACVSSDQTTLVPGATPDGSPTPPTESVSTEPTAPLQGEWATSPLSAADLREVILESGFTDADADDVLGEIRSFDFTLEFEGDRFTLRSSWDGQEVGTLESGNFRLLDDDRLLLDVVEQGDTSLFAIDLTEEGFSLRLLRTTETGSAEDKYKHSYYGTAFYTGHTFRKIGESP